jgi:hypothetical protein
MGPYAEVDYNLTLSTLQIRLQHIYHGIGQPYARVDLNPMPESTLTLCQSRLYPPFRGFGFGLCRIWRKPLPVLETLSPGNQFFIGTNDLLLLYLWFSVSSTGIQ